MNYAELLRQSYVKAAESSNPSTQNGALIVNDADEVLVRACNPFPDGIAETPERLERGLRHKIAVHAERNAVYLAARAGVKTAALTMVCGWATCGECAQAIIQSGLKRLVTHKQTMDASGDFWMPEVELGLSLLREAGIEIIIHDGKVGAPPIRFHKEVIEF